MALRPAPKRNPVDYQKLDDLQKEIFGSELEINQTSGVKNTEKENTTIKGKSQSKSEEIDKSAVKTAPVKKETAAALKKILSNDGEAQIQFPTPEIAHKTKTVLQSDKESQHGDNLRDLETIASRIALSKAGQGRNTTRPFSLPRTLIIDTTRLKAKFRTIDEQYTQNVIIDFLMREALAATTPENYRDLRKSAFEFIKRPEETTRRSLTVTEEVVYQMSELKAGINLETGKKYSNDEIFSTLLAVAVSWLYRSGVLS